ncbi:MAG TPA: VWA domain-containing protein [Anaerolineae bacterium]|nr:VWA domain-containing protein [Anaerolineae bacterium]
MMPNLKLIRIFLFITTLMLVGLACSASTPDDGTVNVPRNAVVIDILSNTAATTWLQAAANEFNAQDIENDAGNQLFVTVTGLESGQAVIDLQGGGATNAIWLPEETVWSNVLADQGNNQYQADCVSTAQSPLVIGMWRPIAQSLGWPGLPLGWLDVGSLAADPNAWQYYSGGLYGDTLRLGHTHPGLSGSGTAALLAIVHAAEAKQEPVSVDDIQRPIVQASVGAFESSVAWFSTSTASLANTMTERGDQYLGAGVMYESSVYQQQTAGADIVPIYPFEGTFVANFPACINGSAPADVQAGARQFRDFLLSPEGQTIAVNHGFRPLDNTDTTAITNLDSFDLNQPTTTFAPPTVATIYAVQDLWQSARKDVNLVMLLDTSGSMRGLKMDNMLSSAIQFVEQMGDDDYISIIAFSTEPEVIVYHQKVGETRQDVLNQIRLLNAGGDTTLFDAVGDGATLIQETTRVDTSNAMIVLTDGQDTRSYRYNFDEDLVQLAAGNSTTIFTIAYGSDADADTLRSLADRANGNFFPGDEASIAAIYEEMSAAFGGSVGVGR